MSFFLLEQKLKTFFEMSFVMRVTLTSTQRHDFNFLLFLAWCLFDLTCIIIRFPIGSTKRIEVGLRTVNVAHTPEKIQKEKKEKANMRNFFQDIINTSQKYKCLYYPDCTMQINIMKVESSVKGSFVFLDGNEMQGEGRGTWKQAKRKIKEVCFTWKTVPQHYHL